MRACANPHRRQSRQRRHRANALMQKVNRFNVSVVVVPAQGRRRCVKVHGHMICTMWFTKRPSRVFDGRSKEADQLRARNSGSPA
jgi:hypothetical protein